MIEVNDPQLGKRKASGGWRLCRTQLYTVALEGFVPAAPAQGFPMLSLLEVGVLKKIP